MPCPRDGSTQPVVTGVPIHDWSGVHPYTPKGIHLPGRLQDLVAIVQAIEGKKQKAKAVGSVWSLSRAPDSDGFVIRTGKLNRYLSRPFPAPPKTLPAARLLVGKGPGATGLTFRSKAHNKAWLADFAGDGTPAQDKLLVHVEAGIQIRQFLADLARMDLAVPTMGAGAGQTLAGAISTSTHGADVNQRLLGDAVRAIHLVGPGGQEWWIEGNGGAGRTVEYAQWPGWCSDTRVVRDSDFLQSVVVGVGRFGIIYSMVLEVERQYRLEERTHETKWPQIRSALRAGITNGYGKASGIFSDPDPCRHVATELNNLKNGTHKKFDPETRQWIDVPPTPGNIAEKKKELEQCLENAKKVTNKELRFGQIVIDTASGSRVWLTRRWLTTNTKDVLKKSFDLLGFLCTHDGATINVVASATAGAAQTLRNLASGLASIPFAGPFLAKDYVELAFELELAAANFTTLGAFAAKVIDLLREFDGVGSHIVKDLLEDIGGTIFSGQFESLRRGPSEKIMDTHNYKLDGCFSVNSAEFFFDANTAAYIEFIDNVRKVAKDLGPLLGIISLRFVSQTAAKIGMQRFPFTVCIEVAVPRPGSANAEYMSKVHALAAQFGGAPHWGQEHQLDVARVEAIYGANLEDWRWALAETEATKAGTFSSQFTRKRGLETRKPKRLAAYRAQRYVAAVC